MKVGKFLLTLLLALPGAVSFAQQRAVVDLSSIYMRIAPDYESALETQELMGTIVEVVGEKGYWREILSPQPYKAWCTDKGLAYMSEAQISEYQNAPKVIFKDLYGHIFSSASLSSATVCDLVAGDLLRLVDEGRKWVKVMTPSEKTGFVLKSQVEHFVGFRAIAKGEGSHESVSEKETEDIIARAMRLLGVPYLWGGMTPKGVDCSGLVRWSYLMNGILLPRNASQQVFCGTPVLVDFDARFWEEENRNSQEFTAEMTSRIKNLERGDLLFFGTPASEGKPRRVTHVGIYLGGGRMIHSSHLVRVNSLIPSESDYYENSHRLLAAVRL